MLKPSSYYKKSSIVLRLFRYVVTLLFVLFLISCIFIFRNDITIENLQLLTKFMTINDGSSLLYDGPFSVNAYEDSQVFIIRDNLGIVTRNNISLYYLSGQKLFSYDFSYSSPAVVHNDHYILVYDIQGKELSVFNSSSKIKSLEFENNILAADIVDDYFAVVTTDTNGDYEVIVYEYVNSKKDYLESYRFITSSEYITGVSIAEDGKNVLITSAKSVNGSYECKISKYNTSSGSDKPVSYSAINDALPLYCSFSSNDANAYAVTDSSIIFYNSSLSPVSEYKFNQSKVDKYFVSDNMIVVTESNKLTGNSMSVTALDLKGNILFNVNVDDEIKDVSFGNNRVFALGKNSVCEFTKNNSGQFTQSRSAKLEDKYNYSVVDTDNNCYLVSNSTVERINF